MLSYDVYLTYLYLFAFAYYCINDDISRTKSGGTGRSGKGKVKCADFEGLWKGIDQDDSTGRPDYSVILASITCAEDSSSATVIGNDSKWGDAVCGTPFQAGGYIKVYTLVDGILSDEEVDGGFTGGIFDITCENGDAALTDFRLGVSTYELLPNGSLLFDDFFVLWKQSSD